MVKSSIKITSKHQQSYSCSLLETQLIVKKLKSEDNQVAEQSFEAQITQIIDFMSQNSAYKLKNFPRSINLLDNILVLVKDMLYDIEFPVQMMANVQKYFIAINKIYDAQQNHYQLEPLLYGCQYLVLLLIYNAGTNPQRNANILTKLFTTQFIDSFVAISVQHCNNKMKRILSLILTYIVKNKPQFIIKTKMLAFQLIYYCADPISRAHLMLVLKKSCKYLKSSQIKKYNISGFLFEALKTEDNSLIRNSLINIYFILSNFKQFTTQFLSMNLMKYWDMNVKKYPQICFSIFQLIIPYISAEKKQLWFKIYINHACKNPQQTSHFHILIIESLINSISTQIYLQALQSFDILKLIQIGNGNDTKMKEAVAKLKERIEKKMEQISPLMLKIHQNLSVGAVWQKLDDLY